MNAELSAICDRILSAVLNGAAQGLLLVLLLIALLRLLRGINAATRHALELTTLVLLALLPVAHFYFDRAELNWFSTAVPPATVPVDAHFDAGSQRIDAVSVPERPLPRSENPQSFSVSFERAAIEVEADSLRRVRFAGLAGEFDTRSVNF